MKIERFSFSGTAGNALEAYIWSPDGEPKVILQVTHGMTEHMGRYEKLAEELAAQGVVTAGFDLPGHGRNPGRPDCASFGESGWKQTLADMHAFSQLLKKRYQNLPLVLLGFSLGSFLVREYLGALPEANVNDKQKNCMPAGAVIMGTGKQPFVVLSMIKKVVEGQIKKEGFNHTTPLVRKLSFGTYNQKFAPNRTDFDWLCADNEELEVYMTDPRRRENISSGLFWQLLDSMQRTGKPELCGRYPKDLPILLLSGADDPVGDAGKGVQAVAALFWKAGLTHVQIELIPHARHDLLHEEASGAAGQARELLKEFIKKCRQ